MARFIYTLAVLALLPWALLHLLWRARRQPEYLRHWGERFGRFGGAEVTATAAPTLWLHAVSVGETRAAQPLVAALRERYPGHRILFTHMTPTGRATSEALFGDDVERIYLPYDTLWAMRRFLRHYRPAFGLIMETELWPNLIAACREAGMPLCLVNARLSLRSAKRYAAFPALTREALRGLAAIGAQTADDAARLGALGARGVTVTGNIKFDIEAPSAQLELARELRARYGRRPVWLAASTREGEEALILDAWQRVGAGNTALLVIVPRHPQRFDEVARLAMERGFALQRRSENASVATTTQILIGDSMGEMFAFYAAADIAFIGGSLLDFGSQNLIEAAACGTPILIGPSTRNFAEAAREAIACGAARTIAGADDLVRQVLGLLADDASRRAMGEEGRAFAERHRGATALTLELISRAVR
ncbi:lipid IV(A) 3-deoxy-D-manno-octulosonic acid transferase [Sulfuritalea sp.]|uniref:lipid IV(A) 3-deoxy-D-manno-octulosonic acid transferase n=1 Tax=Sulfuritalea sp. TaxID=2480090 RepID=UPI00286DCE09|nr:lipid IV(A) 3-deoxy-D-manno-octulosonic acid transferase [Sulfuritalea sp.]